MKKIITIIIASFLLACGGDIIKKIEEVYPSNQPKVVNYIQKINGKEQVVKQKVYYENGNLKIGGGKKNGERNGVWEAYFENGILQSEGEFQNGLRKGFAKVYFPNGKLMYEGQYDKDKEVGHWKFYNEQGVLIKEKDF